MDQVETGSMLDGVSDCIRRDVKICLEQVNQCPDMLGLDIGNEVAIERGARNTVQGAGQGTGDHIGDIEFFEGINCLLCDLNRILIHHLFPMPTACRSGAPSGPWLRTYSRQCRSQK